MLKIYEKYIIKSFLLKFLIVSLIFFSLTIILNVFEEISFFKNSNSSLLLPYFLTALNAPITLFEIFPFIFLISTQFFFYDIFRKDELVLLKNNGLSNFKIIITLFVTTFFMGIFMIVIYYNVASKLKFIYTDIKNNFSNDNKYLAVVNDSGLWLKDETNELFSMQYTPTGIKIDEIASKWLNAVINIEESSARIEQYLIFKKDTYMEI